MSNKTSYLALAVAVIALVVVVVRPAHDISAPTKQESVFEHVMKTRTIRCGYAMWNPVMFKDVGNGQLRGITYDIMEAIGKKLDLHIEWAEETGWGTVIEGLSTHRYDMICNGLGIIAPRARLIDFSRPLFYGPEYLVVRSDEKRIQHNADLNNEAYRLVVLDGEGFSLMAPQLFPKTQTHSLPQNADWSLIFQEIETGKADATGVPMADFLIYDKANPGKLKIINISEPLQVFPIAYGLPQGDVAFKTLIDAALDELSNDGTIERAVRTYEESSAAVLLPAKPYALPPQ